MISATTGRRSCPRFDARRLGAPASGFTLMELMVVVLIIGMIMAIALPQLMPTILISTFEGAARHLAGYGRAAVSQAVIVGETIVVHFDLDKQEYWAERLKSDDTDEAADTEGKEKLEDKLPLKQPASGKHSSSKSKDGKKPFLNLMNPLQMEGEYEDPALDPLHQKFEKLVRSQLEAQTRRLEKEGILSDIGPLFDEPFSLESGGEEYEEIMDPVLERTQMPEGVKIDSVKIGSADHSGGDAQVELTAMGLAEPVVIYIRSEEYKDYYTVVWDPVTGGAQIASGKKDFDANLKKPVPQKSGSGHSREHKSRNKSNSSGKPTVNTTPRRIR